MCRACTGHDAASCGILGIFDAVLQHSREEWASCYSNLSPLKTVVLLFAANLFAAQVYSSKVVMENVASMAQ